LLGACSSKTDNGSSADKSGGGTDQPATNALDAAYTAQFPELKLPYELSSKAVLANLQDQPTVPTVAWPNALALPLTGDEAQYPPTTVAVGRYPGVVGRYPGPEGANRYVTLTYVPNSDAPLDFQVYTFDDQANKYVLYTDNLRYVEMMVRAIDNTVTLLADGQLSIQAVERKFDRAQMQADPNHADVVVVVRDETLQLAFENGQWVKGQ